MSTNTRTSSPSTTSTDTIADALVLTFTAGVSLREWEDTGGLEREWAIYRRLVPGSYPRMIAVTHGDATDLEVARRANLTGAVTIVCNEKNEERVAYEAGVPGRVRALLAGARSAVVKTNQFKGGLLAASIATDLRAHGIRAGLLARAGYQWSRNVGRQEGFGSPAAVEAGSQEGELCRAADAIAVTTPTIAEDVSWRYGTPPSRVRVVPNYIVDAPAAPTQRDANLVLVAGRLHPLKRVEVVIRAIAASGHAAKRRLAIVGDGPQRASLERLARELGVTADFRGRLDHHELLALMARCGLFVQLSLYEGHPKTVLEAMGAGAPTLVADTPGLRDAVRHGRTGMTVALDPDEPASSPGAAVRVADAIDSILADDALRTRLGRAAAEHVRTTLSLSAVLPLEIAAHRAALETASMPAVSTAPVVLPPVRWDPSLLMGRVGGGRPAAAVAAFERGIHGFMKRLPARERCEFLFGLDWPLYQMQGMAAGELEGGLHPKHRLLKYHDFFVNRVRAGDHVIDLGCGNGALVCSIASRAGGAGNGQGASVTGVELHEPTAAKAAARAAAAGLTERVTIHHADITAFRAPSSRAPAAGGAGGAGGFDVLVLSNVLEHIDRRPERLAMWREWYSPRRWLIRVPAFDRDWRAPFKKELGVEWRLDATHETEYTRDQLERELAQAGLAIDELVVNWGEYWCSARDANAAAKEAA